MNNQGGKMNRKGSISLPILIGLIIIVLALASGLFYFYQQEHAKNIQLQEQIEELNVRQRITEAKLGETKKLATEFQLKLQEAKIQVDALTNELTQEKSARLEVSNKMDQISIDLEQQKALRQDLENWLSQSKVEGKKLKDQIQVITQEKIELEAKIKNLESGSNGVELGRVVINPDKTTVSQLTKKPASVEKKVEALQVKLLEGKIAVVNKEYNFAVINLGSKDGVNLGDEFSVTRGGKVIGGLKVEKVHESMSAAGFAVELKDKIRENDVVQKVK